MENLVRKSKQLRQSQAEETLKQFKEAGLEHHRSARFLGDMIFKMRSGKYPTKRQRDWLDTLINNGAPQPDPKYSELAARIAEALEVDGIDFGGILRDFQFKLRCGYSLSEKQVGFAQTLIAKALAIRDGNHWIPDEDTMNLLRLAVDVSACYTQHYWSDRPGLSASLESARRYISGDVSRIDRYRATRLIDKMMPKIKMIKNPKFLAADLCYINHAKNGKNTPGVIVAGPHISMGSIVYDVLVDGEICVCINPKKRRS